MKNFLLFIFLFSSLSCSSQTQPEVQLSEVASEKILIVYLSRTKNTKAVAEMIYEKVGGRLVSLELETPYPEDYAAIVAQVAQENETGILPPLKTKINLTQYEVVFLGFPTWGMQLPPPMKTFLSENDLSGKTVIPFNTNAGYGIGSSFDKVEELCPDSKILEGYSTKGGIERDGTLFVMEGTKEVEVKKEVNDWLSSLGF
ncbi:flavodoxin family protein [Algoriphagus winogradskyi]|uniref:Flavodoxin n=1 Tax=Algoriphagus winogradskyi TaxID=237017 RepID=A0ABY1NG05_9BACT|nr:flavodoxin [Algoriphagus winogradskyi]SMP07920.1 Flavodoxin [Algoriphagus winogradskyi]